MYDVSVIASSCLKTEPRWMKDNQPIIGNLTLLNSFIPGTHDSGSYVLSRAPYIENRWTKYIYTQVSNLQLLVWKKILWLIKLSISAVQLHSTCTAEIRSFFISIIKISKWHLASYFCRNGNKWLRRMKQVVKGEAELRQLFWRQKIINGLNEVSANKILPAAINNSSYHYFFATTD